MGDEAVKRCLILGSSGMAGHVVATYLAEQGYRITRVAGSRRATPDTQLLNLTHLTSLTSFLDRHKFDVVINCVGVLLGDSDKDPAKTIYLNSFLPRYLERYYRNSRTKVIHLSTDCVFSGENGPYREDSPHDGTLLYDRSKALGEFDNGKDLTFRMSIIGPELKSGSGLFHWFMQQQGMVSGYANVIWNGVTTIELAKAVRAAIEQDLTGLYHLTPSSNISKLDLLNLVKVTFNLNITMVATLANPSDRTLLNTREDFAYTVSDYGQMIREMRDWIDAHPELYAQYRMARAA